MAIHEGKVELMVDEWGHLCKNKNKNGKKKKKNVTKSGNQ